MSIDAAAIEGRKRPRRRAYLACLVVLLLVGSIWVVDRVRFAWHEIMTAEYRLHGMYFVLAQLTEFVEDNKRWPRSWDDLPKRPRNSMWDEWPPSGPPLPTLIVIDFGASLEEVAAQNPETLKAVQFTAGAHINHWYPYEELLATVREAAGMPERVKIVK